VGPHDAGRHHDGVQWLVKEGIADPKRVAIYAAATAATRLLSGITYTPDLYAAAVDYVGVANLLTFLKTIPPYWKPTARDDARDGRQSGEGQGLLEAASPVNHADKIKTPLFIAQGAKDPRVNKGGERSRWSRR
jgi:dipeptidyl aminopeptidase/acylaminoacyl peptidase